MKRAKILIVDDHEVVRYGLALLFQQYDHLEVVGTAQNLTEAMVMMEKHRPALVIMDVRLKDSSGIQGCGEITRRYPETRVIMLTSFGDDDVVLESIRAGAIGFVLKDAGNEALIRAVDAAIKGKSMLDPTVTGKLLDHLRKSPLEVSEERDKLTKQERRVLTLIAEGMTNKEIADTIFLSEKTVRNYVSNILSKLNLNNRAEAAVYAIKKGMHLKQ